MPELDVVAVLHGGMLTAFRMCTTLLLAPLIAGLIMAVAQAITQISDSSLSFLPKLAATGAAAWFLGPFLSRTITDYMHQMLDALIMIGSQ